MTMRKMKVLIIDDENLIRRSLRRVFEGAQFEVLDAADGSAGLKLWLDERPDLVILDVLMPGLTGPQILNELEKTKQRLNVKVILISAYTGEYDLNKAQNLGADLFIPKPFQDVFEVVNQAQRLLKPN